MLGMQVVIYHRHTQCDFSKASTKKAQNSQALVKTKQPKPMPACVIIYICGIYISATSLHYSMPISMYELINFF